MSTTIPGVHTSADAVRRILVRHHHYAELKALGELKVTRDDVVPCVDVVFAGRPRDDSLLVSARDMFSEMGYLTRLSSRFGVGVLSLTSSVMARKLAGQGWVLPRSAPEL